MRIVAGSLLFLMLSATCQAQQTASQNMTVTVVGHKVSLSWQASTSSGVTDYNVYRNGVKLGDTKGTTSYVDMDAGTNLTYSYTVSALIGTKEGAQSSPCTVTVQAGASCQEAAAFRFAKPVKLRWYQRVGRFFRGKL